MSDRDAVVDDIRELILRSLVPLDDDELDNDSPLVDDILDSLGIAEIAAFIEERIGRELTPDEETRSTFASIDSVANFIMVNR